LLGKKVPIIGRISMDLTTIDLTSLRNKNLNKNVFVEVIGNKNNVNHLSKIISTISYEILTSLGKRYQRRYIA
jgi:alanine racemase